MNILYSSLTHGAPRIEWVVGAWLLWDYEQTKPAGVKYELHKRHIAVGPYIAKNRNECVVKMRRSGCDALFMVDHDVYTPPQTLEKLVETLQETGVDAVAGDLVLGNDCPRTGFGFVEGDERKFQVLEPPTGENVGIVGVAATSCILIRASVFDLIDRKQNAPPFFGPGTWFMHWPVWDEENQIWQQLGEDFSFSRRVAEVGARIAVRYDLGLDHWKVGRMQPRPQSKELENVRS